MSKNLIIVNVLLLGCFGYNAQEVAKTECERYSNGMERAKIENTIPHASRFKRHIVGGKKSAPSEFPFMVALGYEDGENIQWECGGALISENFVLTAAHCAAHRELGPIKMARMGTVDLTVPIGQAPAQDIPVKNILPHPMYSAPSMYNDIALVKLRFNANFSSTVHPACLHTEPSLDNVLLTAMGWGRLDFTGEQSTDLMKVVLNLFTPEECSRVYESEAREKLGRGIQTETQICAGGREKSPKDTCQGDSGGPLQMASGSKHIIVGITSFGKACGIANTPGVYTRVSAFLPWIENIVWNLY